MQFLGKPLYLVIKSIYYYALSFLGSLPGRRFDLYGRRLALRMKNGGWQRIHLFCNPVSSVRYFEFDFAERNLLDGKGINVLDVSSPSLFGLYVSENRKLDYHYTNLDEREFHSIENLRKYVRIQGKYRMNKVDATLMPYETESYDVVVSISVVEHIPDTGDSKAIKEMWRVLKPGGRLILTFPVSMTYEEEYRSSDVYEIGVDGEEGRYFFQCYYDKEAINKRITGGLGSYKEISRELYGEREPGLFRSYEKRWIDSGLEETVKDPYLMIRYMSFMEGMDDLLGIGIMGMCLEKVR